MIGRLRGHVIEVSAEGAIIDVQGVGYLVHMSSSALDRLGGTGAEVQLMIETVVRADAIRLYGFASAEEKSWFRQLQEVQGVGAKVALAVLGVLPVPELAAAIASADAAAVARAPGVGPKLAKRIVSELKDKVPAGFVPPTARLARGRPVDPLTLARADAISALANLGYAQGAATAAVDEARARLGQEADVAALIKDGLRTLSES